MHQSDGHAKGNWTLWIAAAIIAALTFVFLGTRRPAPAEEPQTAKADVIPAGVIAATPEQLKEIRVEQVREQIVDVDLEATGKVGFNEDRVTPVLPPFPGRVLEILANPGDLIKTGQPLLTVESPDVVTAVNDLIEAHTNVDKAKIGLDTASKAAERARRLHAQEALATKDLQNAESELARAEEDLRRAQAAVDVAQHRLALLGRNPDEIAHIENSSADQIDRRVVIRAPISGTIVDRKVGPGQYIKPDSTDPLFLIGDLSVVWVTADIYENDLPRIRIGAPVTIQLAAYPDKTFPARITSISPTVDVATRTAKVRSVVANSNGLFKPEMFARLRLGNGSKEKVITVPSSAILTEDAHSYVLIEEASGRFRRREIRSGAYLGETTEVVQGLKPSDRVVTSGVLLLSTSESSHQ